MVDFPCIVYHWCYTRGVTTRTTTGRQSHDARPGRESVSKRLGKVARLIRARDGHACVYCGCGATSAPLQLDHLTCRSAGGLDVPSNLVVACRRCNSARQSLTLSQWSRYARVVYGLTISPRAIRAQARRRLPVAA